MSARKPRKDRIAAREAQLNIYMSEIQAMLLDTSTDPDKYEKWLVSGDGYHRGLKQLAEQAIFKLMKAKEVAQNGA